MSQLTSRVFGYLIAYILPGGAALYVISLWFPWVESFLKQVLSVNTNTALFLAASLLALFVGLGINLVRSFFFDPDFRQDIPFFPKATEQSGFSLIRFSRSVEENRLAAVLTALDEGYRYHQFWGGIAVVLPLYCLHWILSGWPDDSSILLLTLAALIALFSEVLLIGAARGSPRRYKKWLGEIMAENPRGSSSVGIKFEVQQ